MRKKDFLWTIKNKLNFSINCMYNLGRYIKCMYLLQFVTFKDLDLEERVSGQKHAIIPNQGFLYIVIIHYKYGKVYRIINRSIILIEWNLLLDSYDSRYMDRVYRGDRATHALIILVFINLFIWKLCADKGRRVLDTSLYNIHYQHYLINFVISSDIIVITLCLL